MPADSIATSVPAPIAMPDVGGRERRGVVHAVADHRDLAAALLEALDGRGLVGGQDLRRDLVDAQAASHRVRDRLAVAGDHGHPDAERVQRVHRRLGLRRGSRPRRRSRPTTRPSTTTWRTVRPSRSHVRARRARVEPHLREQARPADRDVVILDPGPSASTRQRLEGGRGRHGRSRERSRPRRWPGPADARSQPRPPPPAAGRFSVAADIDQHRLAPGQACRSCRRSPC